MAKKNKRQSKESEALQLLIDIRQINHLVEALQEQIDEIHTTLTNATVKPKEINVQTSLPKDPMADLVIQMVEFQKEIQDYQKELVEKKTHALKIVKMMDFDNQTIILLRFFRGFTYEEIGEHLGYSQAQTWRLLDKAKEEFIRVYKMNKNEVE